MIDINKLLDEKTGKIDLAKVIIFLSDGENNSILFAWLLQEIIYLREYIQYLKDGDEFYIRI